MEKKVKEEILFGVHPVLAALETNQRRVRKIIFSAQRRGEAVGKIRLLAEERNIKVEEKEKVFLDRVVGEEAHQGVLAYVSPKKWISLEEILAEVLGREDVFLLLLDGIEDPHNLGAIIRTAEGAGVDAVIIPSHRQVGLTSVVAKTAAGALEYLKVCQVVNVRQAIEKMKKQGIWVVGAEAEAEKCYWNQNFKLPLCLVVGSEGKGLRRLTKEHCDFLVKIPLKGEVNSLNTSVAASLVMYEVLRQRLA
jgi:23S rRNA (guanosine2251-2'-O)-methyltransferase